jgi:1,2-diacylglycerol-3-alpha-glucose alpha-1,2-glucosyltransferase
MNNAERKPKVLLCLNGDKDAEKPLVDRAGVLLRYALEAVGIEYTYDPEEVYDFVHLVSLNQYWAFKTALKKKRINKKAPVIMTLFNDPINIKNDEEDDKVFKQTASLYSDLEADAFICPWSSEALIIKHLNILHDVSQAAIGAKDYDQKSYSPEEMTAFCKYYSIEPGKKIIICYGEYEYSKGIDELESVARILPEYEFFYFGGTSGVLANSKHYDKGNDIPNLHYEGSIPEELYHSAIFSAYAVFLPYRYHTDSTLLVEAMKGGVPIVSAFNPFLFDLLIDGKTALLGKSVEDFFRILKDLPRHNCAEGAKVFASELTPLAYGTKLKEIYNRALLNKKDAD